MCFVSVGACFSYQVFSYIFCLRCVCASVSCFVIVVAPVERANCVQRSRCPRAAVLFWEETLDFLYSGGVGAPFSLFEFHARYDCVHPRVDVCLQ